MPFTFVRKGEILKLKRFVREFKITLNKKDDDKDVLMDYIDHEDYGSEDDVNPRKKRAQAQESPDV